MAEVGTVVMMSRTNSRLLTSGGTSFSFRRFCRVIRSTGAPSLNSSTMLSNIMPYCCW